MSGWPRPCIYLVTARAMLSPDARTTADELAALEAWIDEAVEAGIDAVQIRERDLEARRLRACVARVVSRARTSATRVMVNDRVDVALAAAADGVHLRADGPAIDRVRALGDSSWIVGRSVHSAAEAGRHGTADYLLYGTVFAGGSKPLPGRAADLEGLREAVAATPTPVFAIGGITPERARQCGDVGAAGVAGISVFLPEGRGSGALGPARAVRELRAAMERR